MTAPTAHRNGDDERGAGLVGTFAGVLVFIVFLLFAVQLLFNLYATSAVTAAGLDAARVVAAEQIDHRDAAGVEAATAQAEAKARAVLGRYGNHVSFGWRIDNEVVRLHLRVTNPRVFFGRLGSAIGFDTVDRTVQVRVEKYR
ncbi:MAG: hypothetical protein M3Z46_03895 [Actinomycetota bacterium]|nr:hypothetical protein [Actinomycetota bacterium]